MDDPRETHHDVAAQQDFVIRTLEERDIRFVRLWFTDVLGTLKSVAVAPAEIANAFEGGVGFDGSSIEGFARIHEADMVAMPDPATFQILPPGDMADPANSGLGDSARMFCDIRMPDGRPAAVDPRHVLRRALSRASKAGFTFYTHPEIEFFLLNDVPPDGSEPTPIDMGGYFDHTTHAPGHDFRRHVVLMLERLGIPVEFSHHECAPGQQEIDLRDADALITADNIMTFRYVIREVAQAHGIHATFMPKPFTFEQGSGMHTHLSLFEGESNAFDDPNGPRHLSSKGKSFVAGLLRHALEWTAVANQWVNSYKRLHPMPSSSGIMEAPNVVCWGRANRSALVRVPAYGTPHSARVEVRSPDPACNPYLVFAVLLAAGLTGIEEGYELPEGATDDVWALSASERIAAGYESLPQNLGDALHRMEGSELVRDVLGPEVFDFFGKNKKAEWDSYCRHVKTYERNRYISL